MITLIWFSANVLPKTYNLNQNMYFDLNVKADLAAVIWVFDQNDAIPMTHFLIIICSWTQDRKQSSFIYISKGRSEVLT